MLSPFFAVAMRSPGRQVAFRRAAVAHALAATVLGAAAAARPEALPSLGQVAVVVGIVEGAVLLGWRLTQLPKSQALEFLLVSPVQPRRVFRAEAAAGAARLALVQLAGLPPLLILVARGPLEPFDLLPLLLMPFVWGLFTGLALATWAYEPVAVRRVGELVGVV